MSLCSGNTSLCVSKLQLRCFFLTFSTPSTYNTISVFEITIILNMCYSLVNGVTTQVLILERSNVYSVITAFWGISCSCGCLGCHVSREWGSVLLKMLRRHSQVLSHVAGDRAAPLLITRFSRQLVPDRASCSLSVGGDKNCFNTTINIPTI